MKIAIFPTLGVFDAAADGVSLGTGYWRIGSEIRMMGIPGKERSLVSSAVWIQYTVWVTDRQTDGHWPTAKTVLTHSVAQ